MIETTKERSITRETLQKHPEFERILQDSPEGAVTLLESPWMPLTPFAINEYQEGTAANRTNLALRGGCDSCLSTTTVQPNGTIAACCGIAMRRIPELHMGNIRDTRLSDADNVAANDTSSSCTDFLVKGKAYSLLRHQQLSPRNNIYRKGGRRTVQGTT
jgi:hypothetical protein